MLTVHEVCALTGVSARTLRYYDAIGLLKPTAVTEAAYRLYDGAALARLQTILLFRELSFSLEEIRTILDNPTFDRKKALFQQLHLLELKQERLTELIAYVRSICENGGNVMDFKAFDNQKLKDYAKQAKEKWGSTEAYREYEARCGNDSPMKQKADGAELMQLFAEFGRMKALSPEEPSVQAQVEKLRQFITDHYYTCTKPILAGLGQMYVAGGEMTDNIDAFGGTGTAAFVGKAIEIYCKE